MSRLEEKYIKEMKAYRDIAVMCIFDGSPEGLKETARKMIRIYQLSLIEKKRNHQTIPSDYQNKIYMINCCVENAVDNIQEGTYSRQEIASNFEGLCYCTIGI